MPCGSPSQPNGKQTDDIHKLCACLPQIAQHNHRMEDRLKCSEVTRYPQSRSACVEEAQPISKFLYPPNRSNVNIHHAPNRKTHTCLCAFDNQAEKDEVTLGTSQHTSVADFGATFVLSLGNETCTAAPLNPMWGHVAASCLNRRQTTAPNLTACSQNSGFHGVVAGDMIDGAFGRCSTGSYQRDELW